MFLIFYEANDCLPLCWYFFTTNVNENSALCALCWVICKFPDFCCWRNMWAVAISACTSRVFLFLQGSLDLMFVYEQGQTFLGPFTKIKHWQPACLVVLVLRLGQWLLPVAGLVPASCFARLLVPSSLSDSFRGPRMYKMAKRPILLG